MCHAVDLWTSTCVIAKISPLGVLIVMALNSRFFRSQCDGFLSKQSWNGKFSWHQTTPKPFSCSSKPLKTGETFNQPVHSTCFFLSSFNLIAWSRVLPGRCPHNITSTLDAHWALHIIFTIYTISFLHSFFFITSHQLKPNGSRRIK